jgi:hypothetical protein
VSCTDSKLCLAIAFTPDTSGAAAQASARLSCSCGKRTSSRGLPAGATAMQQHHSRQQTQHDSERRSKVAGTSSIGCMLRSLIGDMGGCMLLPTYAANAVRGPSSLERGGDIPAGKIPLSSSRLVHSDSQLCSGMLCRTCCWLHHCARKGVAAPDPPNQHPPAVILWNVLHVPRPKQSIDTNQLKFACTLLSSASLLVSPRGSCAAAESSVSQSSASL